MSFGISNRFLECSQQHWIVIVVQARFEAACNDPQFASLSIAVRIFCTVFTEPSTKQALGKGDTAERMVCITAASSSHWRVGRVGPTMKSGKHRCHSATQTKIQQHQSNRILVHGVAWLHSHNCERRAPREKPVCWKVGFILRGGNSNRAEQAVGFAYANRSRAQEPVSRNSHQLSANADGGLFCRAN